MLVRGVFTIERLTLNECPSFDVVSEDHTSRSDLDEKTSTLVRAGACHYPQAVQRSAMREALIVQHSPQQLLPWLVSAFLSPLLELSGAPISGHGRPQHAERSTDDTADNSGCEIRHRLTISSLPNFLHAGRAPQRHRPRAYRPTVRRAGVSPAGGGARSATALATTEADGVVRGYCFPCDPAALVDRNGRLLPQLARSPETVGRTTTADRLT
jgi:hypothetical protein